MSERTPRSKKRDPTPFKRMTELTRRIVAVQKSEIPTKVKHRKRPKRPS